MKKHQLPKHLNEFSLSKILGFLFTRAFIFTTLVVVQVLFLFVLLVNVFPFSFQIYLISLGFNFLISLYLISSRDNPAYKLAWLFFIFIIPPTGGLIYLYTRLRHLPTKKTRSYTLLHERLQSELVQQKETLAKISHLPSHIRQQFHYLWHQGSAAVYEHTQTHYLPVGEDFFTDLKDQLRLAKKFIFLEFFIIREGQMWNELLAILRAKVKEGVEVRLLYDDIGSLILPGNFAKKMAQLGIQAHSFNRFRPFIQIRVNNRDHRKIVVIDGRVGYLGGINIADEYINLISPYGHWKDSGVRLTGDATKALTLIFLQMWNASKQYDFNFDHYRQLPATLATDGLIQPFGDEPQGNEFVSESVYLNLINKAKNKVMITTPYLVIDNELFTALTLAAKNGVDARIIVPSIPDKWYVRFLSQAFYAGLIEAGVKVYEYLPGFIHAKTILADDEIGVVGTINLDYRSFFLHFEAGVLMYKTKALTQLQADFEQTITKSRLVPLEHVKEVRFGTHLLRSLMRLIAPLI